MTTVSLVGSTGSVGTQAVDVLAANPERFEVVALGANRSLELLAAQARRLHPKLVVIEDERLVGELKELVPAGTAVSCGASGTLEAASSAEVVLNAVVGFAGLPVTVAALEAGSRLALANKESLVAGAPVVKRARATPGARIVPVDSEHCAVHQCLGTVASPEAVGRLVITASGGPFRGLGPDELARVSVADALAHPTWSMGPKITVDSSTLMNKGLEVIEAHELFGIDYDRIDVVVHPQSIVHSMVELSDGSTLAQMSLPDMRLPIGYALGHPDRLPTAYGALDWGGARELTFEPPNRDLFKCLDLAYEAGRLGGAAPAWLNAANEMAVAAFLAERIDWVDIARVVSSTLEGFEASSLDSYEAVLDADRRARSVATSVLGEIAKER